MSKETIADIIRIIGDNPTRPGLIDTPERVLRMWQELFRGYKEPAPSVTTFDNGEDGIVYDQMIMDMGSFYSHCEHHLVPFFGQYYFAYIPHPKGKLLGLSKISRVVDHFSAKLQIQERLVHEVVEYLWTELSKEGVEPIAMGLVMEAEHLCKTMRGPKKPGKMRTTELRGALLTEASCRNEFMNWLNSK